MRGSTAPQRLPLQQPTTWNLCSWSPSAAAWTPSPPTKRARSWRRAGKLYTQIKIDEITNLGAVNIRLRSLLGALDEMKVSGDMQAQT